MRSNLWLSSLLLIACGSSATVVEAPPPPPPPPPLSSFCGDSAAFARAAGEGKPREEIARLFLAQCGLEGTIALTSDLIRFPTVSEKEAAADGPSFKAMADYLKAWAERSGMRFESYGK